jgi:Flp pilus assembly pilin Flp
MNNVGKATFTKFLQVIRSRWLGQRGGQTLVEYALILAIISVVAIGVMINLGKQVSGVYSMITSEVATAQASH